MTGWWAARQRLRQRERELGPALGCLAVSKARLDARLGRASPALLTGLGFGLGVAAGQASRRGRPVQLPGLYGVLLAHLDKAITLLLAWAVRGGGRPFDPTPVLTPKGDAP